MPSRCGETRNLTAVAERLPQRDGMGRALRVLESAAGHAFEVLPPDGAAEWPEEPGEGEAIYVVISGEGALRCGAEVVECAAGDVLFVPARTKRRFERLSRGFSAWRISLGPGGT